MCLKKKKKAQRAQKLGVERGASLRSSNCVCSVQQFSLRHIYIETYIYGFRHSFCGTSLRALDVKHVFQKKRKENNLVYALLSSFIQASLFSFSSFFSCTQRRFNEKDKPPFPLTAVFFSCIVLSFFKCFCFPFRFPTKRARKKCEKKKR